MNWSCVDGKAQEFIIYVKDSTGREEGGNLICIKLRWYIRFRGLVIV